MSISIKKSFVKGMLVVVSAFSLSANAAIINLGFSLDESSSVGTVNFSMVKNALADALSVIPTTGGNQYRIGITTFNNRVTPVVTPTILTSANLADIQNQVRNTLYKGGATYTHSAISHLTNWFLPFKSDLTLFNLTTDGYPTNRDRALTAARVAHNSYVDGISFEVVYNGTPPQHILDQLAVLAGLGTSGDGAAGVIVEDLLAIPKATETGFVIKVAGFDEYAAAIRSKIQQIVDDTSEPVSAPSSLMLFILVFCLLGLKKLRTE